MNPEPQMRDVRQAFSIVLGRPDSGFILEMTSPCALSTDGFPMSLMPVLSPSWIAIFTGRYSPLSPAWSASWSHMSSSPQG